MLQLFIIGLQQLLCHIMSLIFYSNYIFTVVKDFLRLTKDFMDKGPNSNLYEKAAGIFHISNNLFLLILNKTVLLCRIILKLFINC